VTANGCPATSSTHPATWKHGYPIYHAETREQWAAWLEANHDTRRGVWLATWKPPTGRPVLDYDAIVEEALCWGWIDSTLTSLDDDRRLQLMTPRKPKSTWSQLNKQRVHRLQDAGRMRPAGVAVIETAKANGWWSILDDVDQLIEPDDLAAALDAVPDARRHWDRFPPLGPKTDVVVDQERRERPDPRRTDHHDRGQGHHGRARRGLNPRRDVTTDSSSTPAPITRCARAAQLPG